MHTWDWSLWALVILIACNAALAAFEWGRYFKVSRDVTHTAIALVATGIGLGVMGYWR